MIPPAPNNKRITRNLILFVVFGLGGGWLGALLNNAAAPADPMQGPGTLLWLASPLLMVILLRAFGGDGWQDFGLWPKLRGGAKWYLAALLITPLVTLPILLLGSLMGAISLSGFAEQGFGPYLTAMAVAFGGAMVKNIFEEFSWRGYVSPRLMAMGPHPFVVAAITGVIWTAWHIPYYLFFLNRAELSAHTTLSVPMLIAIAFIMLPVQSLAYNELRQNSQTTWTAWLMHNVANAISLPLLSGGFVVLSSGIVGTLLSPGTEGVLYSILMGVVGYALYRYRTSHTAPAA